MDTRVTENRNYINDHEGRIAAIEGGTGTPLTAWGSVGSEMVTIGDDECMVPLLLDGENVNVEYIPTGVACLFSGTRVRLTPPMSNTTYAVTITPWSSLNTAVRVFNKTTDYFDVSFENTSVAGLSWYMATGFDFMVVGKQ
ncbi:MAG: hypothetical protein COS89_03290 [Deltaproteobacteria bacterium CG07_land_8_20_14_0_80_38_7]|nr:MAG: hypothetical protein COS89_03290 [Deltaproteobacteria bacterium CG07_land_8_20_14_0_80_38_7]